MDIEAVEYLKNKGLKKKKIRISNLLRMGCLNSKSQTKTPTDGFNKSKAKTIKLTAVTNSES